MGKLKVDLKIIKLWKQFSEIEVDAEDCILTDFYIWEKGTDKFYIWGWFGDRCPNGIYHDLINCDNHE